MIVVSRALQLQQSIVRDANNPVIGYRNFALPGAIEADSAAEFYPASNLANPATDPTQSWKSETADAQNIDFTIDVLEPVNYVGIARHNLGSIGASITIKYPDPENEGDWLEAVEETIPGNDDVLLFRFPDTYTGTIRISLGEASEPPQIAVIYVGKLLIVERAFYVGHTPITFARQIEVNSGRSQRGDFLGRIVTSRSRANSFTLQNLKPDWYRSNFDPFVKACEARPFFFAWRPQKYPGEVGYCWFDGDVKPVNQRANGMVHVDVPLGGIAE